MEQFHAWLQEQFEQRSGSSKVRNRAWQLFSDMGLPSHKSAAYRYVRLRDLYERPTQPIDEIASLELLSECGQSALVMQNGEFDLDHSTIPEGVEALSLEQAMGTYGAFLNGRLTSVLKSERDPFSLVNSALHAGGLFLYVPPGKEIELPLQIHQVAGSPTLVMPRVHGFIGAGAKVTLVLTVQGTSSVNRVLDLAIEEGAQVELAIMNLDRACLIDALRATLKRNASLKMVAVTNGGQTVRQDVAVSLVGEGAEADLMGVWSLAEKRQAHTHIRVEHAAPHTRSHQLFKGVLRDLSRSSFAGMIDVAPIAQKTDAFQLNKNLLLSERASAHSKPGLEIRADDVKASHGATVGQLDPEEILYLCTRGLSQSDASSLLVRGFIEEVTRQLPLASLREALL